MKTAPVIIVRKKGRGHGGHHGGAWKVAYADFVTALMAFFLVMWLVGQSSAVKKAVAAYFKDPGVFEATKGALLEGGQGGIHLDPASPPPPGGADEAALENTAQAIRKTLAAMPKLTALRDQVEFEVTAEGLRIELVESKQSAFFDTGSSRMRPGAEEVLAAIATQLSQIPNGVVVEGHTDSRQYPNPQGYTNWELSTDRANAARRVLERNGVAAAHVREVRGYADTRLRFPGAPLDDRNRRVSVIVQRRTVGPTPAG